VSSIIITSRYHFFETLKPIIATRYLRAPGDRLPPELTPLIPGIYADAEGCLYLNMREFLTAHGMPDVPQVRAVAWEEIKEIFAGIEITEITD
jgi:hypothetical protein